MKVDFIVVGQGIAGTLLSHFLVESGKRVFVIDKFDEFSSSNIAAGIIHPITGRRLVKTAYYNEAFDLAKSTYHQIEKKFDQTFFEAIPILEVITSIKNLNDWQSKSTEPGFENLIGKFLPANIDSKMDTPFGAVEIMGGGYLKLKEMIACYRKYLIEINSFIDEQFEFSFLSTTNTEVQYKEIFAQKIIFCEGYHAKHNPYFREVPFQPAKGEVLILSCKALSSNYIINKEVYILPIGNKLFKVGATFDWENLNSQVTDAAKEKIVAGFEALVKAPYKIIEQYAGVRPTIKNRNPIVAFHPQNKNMAIFNGLGTKGVLLAPMLAKKMCNMLMS